MTVTAREKWLVALKTPLLLLLLLFHVKKILLLFLGLRMFCILIFKFCVEMQTRWFNACVNARAVTTCGDKARVIQSHIK